MDTQEKIEIYEELRELRYNFRRELLSELTVYLETLKYSPDDEHETTESEKKQQRIGYDDCKSSLKYKLDELIRKL